MNFTAAHNVEIINTGDKRGRIVIASHDFPKGSLIFHERPLVAIQSVFNKSQSLVCTNCQRFIGNLKLHANLLTRKVSRFDIMESLDEKKGTPLSTTSFDVAPLQALSAEGSSFTSYSPCDCILCPSGCGELYCSQSCVTEHQQQGGHNLLCTGPHAADHPIVRFKTHAVTTNEIFLFAAVVASQFVRRCQQGKTPTEAWSIFASFVQLPWWEAVQPTSNEEKGKGEGKGEGDTKFANELKRIALESLTLFRETVSLYIQSIKEEDKESKKKQIGECHFEL